MSWERKSRAIESLDLLLDTALTQLSHSRTFMSARQVEGSSQSCPCMRVGSKAGIVRDSLALSPHFSLR